MDDDLLAAFADQIALEQASAQAYLQMAAWASAHDLTGTTAWLRAQAAEETGHALRFLDFVLDRGAEIRLQALAAPPADYDSVVAVFEAALVHERRVSRSIGELYAAAQAAGDYQSLPLLSWFLAEQVEEEASVRTILGELRFASADPTALLLLDRELPTRRQP
jgi:ferritin